MVSRIFSRFYRENLKYVEIFSIPTNSVFKLKFELKKRKFARKKNSLDPNSHRTKKNVHSEKQNPPLFYLFIPGIYIFWLSYYFMQSAWAWATNNIIGGESMFQADFFRFIRIYTHVDTHT